MCCNVLQCVAVCFSVLQCVVANCSKLQRVVVPFFCNVLQYRVVYVAVTRTVLPSVSMSCRVLPCVTLRCAVCVAVSYIALCSVYCILSHYVVQCGAVWRCAIQSVAVRCNVCYSVLQ